MARTGSVARFATDTDLRPGRLELGRGCVVILLQICGVAESALVVPVLIDPGPVKRISCSELAIRVQMIPALPAVARGPRVPCNAECLQPASGQSDQVLLQRRDAESIENLEILEFSVRSVGSDPEFSFPFEENAFCAVLVERDAIEVSK